MRERTMTSNFAQQEAKRTCHVNQVWLKDYFSHFTANDDTIMHDVVTPNYHQLSKQGHIINNNMDRSRIWTEATPMRMNLTINTVSVYTGEWLWDHPLGFHDISYDPSYLMDQAVTQAWANVSAAKATALVTIAEGQKSIKGIISVFHRLLKILRAVRRLRLRELKRLLSPKELADAWLEIRYGIRPLLYDAKQVMDVIYSGVQMIGSRQTYRGHKEHYAFETLTRNTSSAGSAWTSHVHYDYDCICSLKTNVRAGVLARLDHIIEAETWGFFDYPAAILDLTTFSFVVGWFFNIADFVKSFTPSASYKALASWNVVEVTKTQMNTLTTNKTYQSPDSDGGLSGGHYARYEKSAVRIADPTRSMIPSFALNLDVSKLIDIVALAKGSFNSIRSLRI